MIVLTNGCFDLLHEGHKNLLTSCAHLANKDKLYILIDTDESIKQLKGPSRPIDTLKVRTQKIHNFMTYDLKYTNFVIWSFDTQDSLKRLMAFILPDLVVKGSDRTDLTQIVGYNLYPICILPYTKNISTTKIIEEQYAKSIFK